MKKIVFKKIVNIIIYNNLTHLLLSTYYFFYNFWSTVHQQQPQPKFFQNWFKWVFVAAAVIFGDFPFIDFLFLDNNCGITRYRVAKFGKKTLKVSKVISIKNEIDKHFIYSHWQRPLFGIIEFKNIVILIKIFLLSFL